MKKKGCDFLLGRMYFTGNDGYQKFTVFMVFAPMPSSLILDINKKVTHWILTRILFAKIEPFDTNLEPNMSNLANGRVILKLKNFVLIQKKKILPCIVTLFEIYT